MIYKNVKPIFYNSKIYHSCKLYLKKSNSPILFCPRQCDVKFSCDNANDLKSHQTFSQQYAEALICRMGIHCESRPAAGLDSVTKMVAALGGWYAYPWLYRLGMETWICVLSIWTVPELLGLPQSELPNSSHTSFSTLTHAVYSAAGSPDRCPDRKTPYRLHRESTSRARYHCRQRTHHHRSDPAVLGLPRSTRVSCSSLLACGLQLPTGLSSSGVRQGTLSMWSPWATGEVFTTLWETGGNILIHPSFEVQSEHIRIHIGL